MTFSNMKTTLTLAAALVCVTGCKMGKREANAQQTFTVDQITAKVDRGSSGDAESSSATNGLGLDRQKQVAMTACFKDAALGDPIKGARFEVTDEAGASQVRTTDGAGCIHWSERHSFDPLEQETAFQMKRKFTALEIYSGSTNATVAFNPWKDQVADLGFEVIDHVQTSMQPVGFNSALKTGVRSNAHILINSLNMAMMGNVDYSSWEVDTTLDLKIVNKYRVSFSPKVNRRGADGTWIPVVPKAGTVRMDMVLFRTRNESDVRNLFSNLTKDLKVAASVESKVFNILVSGDKDTLTATATDYIDLKYSTDAIADLSSPVLAIVTFTPSIPGMDLAPSSFYGMVGPLPGTADVSLQPLPVGTDVMEKLGRRTNDGKQQQEQKQELGDEDSKGPIARPVDGFLLKNHARVLKPGPFAITEPGGFFAAPKTVTLSQADLEDVAQRGQAAPAFARVAKFLCKQIYPVANGLDQNTQKLNKAAQQNCESNPLNTVSVSARQFVEKVLDKPKRVGLFGKETLVMETNFAIAEDHSVETGDKFNKDASIGVEGEASISGDASVGVKAGCGQKDDGSDQCKGGRSVLTKIIGLLGGPRLQAGGGVSAGISAKLAAKGSMGKEWYRAEAHSVKENITTQITTVSQRSVQVNSINLQVSVLATSCAVFEPTLKHDGHAVGGTILVCTHAPAETTIVEPYYFISPVAMDDTAVGSGQDDDLRQVVRGNQVYLELRKLLTDKNTVFVLSPMKSIESDPTIDQRYKNLFLKSKLSEEFPGLVSKHAR